MRVGHVAVLLVGASLATVGTTAAAPIKYEFGLSGPFDMTCRPSEDSLFSQSDEYEGGDRCGPTGIFFRPSEPGVPQGYSIDGTMTLTDGFEGRGHWKATVLFDDGKRLRLRGRGAGGGLSVQYLDESEQGPGMVALAEMSFGGAGLSVNWLLEEYYGTPECPPHSLVAVWNEDPCKVTVAHTFEELSYINFGAGIDNHDTFAWVDTPKGSTGRIELNYFRRVEVPEPAALALLTVGAVTAVYRRRRLTRASGVG